MNQPTASIIAAVIAGLVGILVGLIAAGVQYRMKSDELFYKALDFLGGGTQQRNLGIAAIELSWNKRRFRPISTALLIGSALYLLLESKQEQAAHEVYNLRRIMKHLLHPDKYKVSTQAEYEQLQAALLQARQAAEARESDTGTVRVSRGLTFSKEELQGWENVLARMQPDDKAEAPPAAEEADKDKPTR
jgi:hypothetical protein